MDSIDIFLTQALDKEYSRNFLAGDASFRKYERIITSQGNYVLMDSSLEKSAIIPFVSICNWLVNNSLSAPKIINSDLDNGYLLLEDLGDNLYSRYLSDKSSDETHLYQHAIDIISEIEKREVKLEDIKRYDINLLIKESELFIDWYLKDKYDANQLELIRKDFINALEDGYSKANLKFSTLVMRDYHADNLLWLPDREGIKKVGLLDFQDAVLGDSAYDIVSLLQDARRDVSDELASQSISYYLAASGENEADFLKRYSFLGVQRNLKIIGIFHRLNLRDGKSGYLKFLPRVWDNLQKNLDNPVNAGIKNIINKVTREK